MNIDITLPPMPPPRPLGRTAPAWGGWVGGVISIFILISIWLLIFISLLIWISRNIERYCLLFIRYSLLGIPYCVFPIGYSLLGIPYWVFPIGCKWLHADRYGCIRMLAGYDGVVVNLQRAFAGHTRFTMVLGKKRPVPFWAFLSQEWNMLFSPKTMVKRVFPGKVLVLFHGTPS